MIKVEMMNSLKKIFFVATLLLIATGWSSCKKFLVIDPPSTSINEGNVYQSDATAIAVLTGIYTIMAGDQNFSGSNGISVRAGLSGDELTLASVVSDQRLIAYYRNQLRTSPSENYGTELWSANNGLFNYIFTCNAAIEGLNNSQSLTASVKSQLLGEAKFMRAFFYFYLVNFYGDVPLVLSTNPNINAVLPRSSTTDVYKQIVTDLKDAQALLSEIFLDATLLNTTTERVRPTKWAATALLARVYLYTGDYEDAETQATSVINQTGLFSLTGLNNTFLKNSKEAIWQLQPVQYGRNTEDAFTFILPKSGPNSSINPVYLSPQLLAAFEIEDKRRKGGKWVDSVKVKSSKQIYFFPSKYKATTGSVKEYLMMFRLAEQYLISAEARAQLNNIGGAQDDLNIIRTRAGLSNTTANDQSSLIAAILHERQVELFSELGQRWLDLKRTGNVNSVMSVVTPLKGGTWNADWQLYPVPFSDIQEDQALVQNPGY
jgi:hypothetical protein